MGALEAVDAAAYAALSAENAVDAPVYQHAPQDIGYPVVLLGDVDNAEPIGRAGDGDLRGDLAVIVMTEAEERSGCAALMAQVKAALDGRSLASGGFTITLAQQSATITLDESGQGYNGLLVFGFLALAD